MQIAAASAASAQEPDDVFEAPATTLSADGLTATDGTRQLSVSKAAGLAPDGELISVTGTGYNEEKGIYVAFCVMAETPTQPPTPCGGGIDISGETGASKWISSNPPSYGEGLATPYGPGGSFSVTLAVGPAINDELDCREVRCAIVTRNDHTRSSDRSQDILVPITFAAPGQEPPTPVPTAEPAPSPVPPTATATAAVPETLLSADGLTATQAGRGLTVSRVEGLDPAGEEVTVQGAGFDAAVGIYVSLCSLPQDGAKPACAAGGAASAWISDGPPDYAADLAASFEDGGSFEVVIRLSPVIDAETDCRVMACGVVARPDDASGAPQTGFIAVPVTFADSPAAGPEDEVAAVQESNPDESGSPAFWLLAVIAVTAVAMCGAYFVYQRKSRHG